MERARDVLRAEAWPRMSLPSGRGGSPSRTNRRVEAFLDPGQDGVERRRVGEGRQ